MASEQPIRAEIFSIERLEQHAESLAAAQTVTSRPQAGRPIAARLHDNARVLADAYRKLSKVTRSDRPIMPAAEWLLDNYHVVEEQIREIADDLPPGFYRELPKLAGGPLKGYPRVVGVAWAFVAHTDSRFDLNALVRFVAAYQRVQPLTIGELWAIAITLRLTLVENLRRLAEAIVRDRAAALEADVVADRLLGAGDAEAEDAHNVLLSIPKGPLPTAFAVQLDHRLRDQDQIIAPALRWLDERLAAQGTTADQLVQDDLRTQGAMNLTVRNIITSMRFISIIDWAEFFESVSLVDKTLRNASDFAQMDFPTRDFYRQSIEKLARGSERPEIEVATAVIATAAKAKRGKDDPERKGEPGYYLVGRGRRSFEEQLGYRPPVADWFGRVTTASGSFGYLTSIALASAVILALPLALLDWMETGIPAMCVLALLGAIPASDFAVVLVNRVFMKRFGPAILPGLELKDGVPDALRTIVVVPTLLTSVEDVREQTRRLEVHYLSSKDGEFYFALLSDWTDSGTETAPSDDELLEAAANGIAQLNRRYGPGSAGPRFALLHRRRAWNPREGRWIGWERKRGKLHQLNRLLRGDDGADFLPIAGKPPAVPSGVRYVITLDADTRLPRETARRLVGKMAHVLNRPRLDPVHGRVVEGHAILQPRVTPSLPVGREGSLFQRMFSAPRGLDPYAFAVSDVYQDLFGEGSFVGKGIYEVDGFEAALDGRIAENTILSHDLLEGTLARAGLASDVEVVEEYPTRYEVAAARQHRWTRGDWQLLPWIFGIGRDLKGRPRSAAIHAIGRWKMIDNLRRSLSAPAYLAGFIAGWTLPLADAEIWTGFLLATMILPSLLPWVAGLIPRRAGISKRSHFRASADDLCIAAIQTGFLLTFLAHQAWVMTDAVLRTLFRLLTRRRLLEWVTAAQSKASAKNAWRSGPLVGSLIFVGAVIAGLWAVRPETLVLAFPLLLLWAASPIIAWWASRCPPTVGHLPMTVEDAHSLRLIARRTWRFFETFVTAQDNMLPPDNFQEEPLPALAHRTSPTNIGLYLLSVVAAQDFGWLGVADTVARIEGSIEAMKKLERFRGHFYNWYATEDLRALSPKYVSTVDSGNLAGHMIALANACREIIEDRLPASRRLSGIADAVALARETLDALAPTGSVTPLNNVLRQIEAGITGARDASSSPQPLAELHRLADSALAMAKALPIKSNDAEEVLAWVESIGQCVQSHERDLPARAAPVFSYANDDELIAASAVHAAGRGDTILAAVKRRTGASKMSGPAADIRSDLIPRLQAIVDYAETILGEMNFDFLIDPQRKLFSIGYRVDENELDSNCYDLLASEARLASFVAIAKGDVPAKHWFRLGRTLAAAGHGSVLISWSGSMFEYLMPSLVMRAPGGSILGETNRIAVQRQIAYGASLNKPWGISESQYNARDLEFTYQYTSFGVPELGFKRGLSDDIVIAPYATALAAMVAPVEAARNFRHLAAEGGRGVYGWYEALDYTPARLPEGERVAVIRAYMAHHQAMTIVALANTLGGAMRDRFHAEPIIEATELVLQERMPRDIAVARPPARKSAPASADASVVEIQRHYRSAHSRIPRAHLLSNGNYAVMVTAAGSGYSRWRNIAITRWHEDVTCDNWGNYIFLRDTRSGDVWSAGYQPVGTDPDAYDVNFSEGRVEIARSDGTLRTVLEVAVSAEHDAEARRLAITNLGGRAREIEVTSYAELVLAPPADDAAHPAFAKLFVETEFDADSGTLLATRRRRTPNEPEIWVAHLACIEGEERGKVQFETERGRFLGRGQTVRTPSSVCEGWPLSNTAGTVLDPIFSLRHRVSVPGGSTVRLTFWTLVAGSRAEALDLADKFRDATAFERAATLAWTHAQGLFHHLSIGPEEAHLFQRLANRVIYSNPALRPPSDAIKRAGKPLSALWAHGISGDLPIVLLRVDEADDLDIVRQLLRAHEYWRQKRLAVDLVIINERASSYMQDLQTALDGLVRTSQLRPKGVDDVRGGVFALRADLVPAEVQNLLAAVARAVIVGRRGSLFEQMTRLEERRVTILPMPRIVAAVPERARTRPALEYFNGLGGFANSGREYVTILERGQTTPAPWINVVANPSFGFQTSTDGSGYTWSQNSQQNRLTPWSNDPVGDQPGEALYIRDEDTGELWSPTPLPIREEHSSYLSRHGQGFVQFELDAHGISHDLTQFVPLDDSVKISRLKLVNRSRRVRRLSITSYTEWVLGPTRAFTPFIYTELDPETGAMLARNLMSTEFGGRVAFADLDGRQTSWTGDRGEFIGRNGSLARPQALARGTPFSNRTGAGLDPCTALQTSIVLKPGGALEISAVLGEAATQEEAQTLIAKYRTANLDLVQREVTDFWDQTLGAVQVKTPDRGLDILLNRWLLYQTLVCRIWARSAFYQSGGAYGFRDQLQDVNALCLAKPDVAREHLLRAAARQFPEGDVMHWWMPQSGKGVRTRVSDDRIWLAYVAEHYVATTGDVGVLDEMVPFIEGPLLNEGEHDAYFEPRISDHKASLFEHCALALDTCAGIGAHGLPLMGAGDWNDGMNRVGDNGGESVWLGWFQCAALTSFAALADARGATTRAATWRARVSELKVALEDHAWDGDWYRRAYFGDGTALGSVANSECRIDSIAQSWSVISGAGEPSRATRAMAAVEKYLVKRDDGLVLLFTPPFDKSLPDPGYVKSYPPGIRENGGQYTHAALWAALAYAMLGDGDKAMELLSLLNPIHHAGNSAAIHRYRVEPYVVCADLYSVSPHVGRGGWTWYTGSSAWMYRIALERILGLRVMGDRLMIDPCIPKHWPHFEMTLHHKGARYDITVENPKGRNRGVASLTLDGKDWPVDTKFVPLADANGHHRVHVILG